MKTVLLFVLGLFTFILSSLPALPAHAQCYTPSATENCSWGYTECVLISSPRLGQCCSSPTFCESDQAIYCCQGSTSACQYLSSAYTACVDPETTLSCYWSPYCFVPLNTTANCCVGDSRCLNITGTSYTSYLSCKSAGCSWSTNCGAIPVPSPLPTRPPPQVYCNLTDSTDRSTRPNATHKGILTDLGCIPYEAQDFVGGALRWAIGIGSGIAVLVLGYAAFLYVASGGDPKKIQSAKELVVALIGGLLLIVFSVLILNYLGVSLFSLNSVGFRF